MTSNDITLIQYVQPHELTTPNLSPAERNTLWLALNAVAAQQNTREGMKALNMDVRELGDHGVFVGCNYPKQTDSAPRIEGEDYVALPGVSKHAQFGPIVRVFRRKNDAAVRFTIWSVPRQGYTTIIPDGLTGFSVMPIPEHESRKGD